MANNKERKEAATAKGKIAKEMREQGSSYKDIASRLGYSINYIGRLLRNYDWKLKIESREAKYMEDHPPSWIDRVPYRIRRKLLDAELRDEESCKFLFSNDFKIRGKSAVLRDGKYGFERILLPIEWLNELRALVGVSQYSGPLGDDYYKRIQSAIKLLETSGYTVKKCDRHDYAD